MTGWIKNWREHASLRCAESHCTSFRGSPDRRTATVSGRRRRRRQQQTRKRRRLYKREPACLRLQGPPDRRIRARTRGGRTQRTRSPRRRREARTRKRGRRRESASPPVNFIPTRFRAEQSRVVFDRKRIRRGVGRLPACLGWLGRHFFFISAFGPTFRLTHVTGWLLSADGTSTRLLEAFCYYHDGINVSKKILITTYLENSLSTAVQRKDCLLRLKNKRAAT